MTHEADEDTQEMYSPEMLRQARKESNRIALILAESSLPFPCNADGSTMNDEQFLRNCCVIKDEKVFFNFQKYEDLSGFPDCKLSATWHISGANNSSDSSRAARV